MKKRSVFAAVCCVLLAAASPAYAGDDSKPQGLPLWVRATGYMLAGGLAAYVGRRKREKKEEAAAAAEARIKKYRGLKIRLRKADETKKHAIPHKEK